VDVSADLKKSLDSISRDNLDKVISKVFFQTADILYMRASGGTLSHLLLLTLKKGWSFEATPSLFPIDNINSEADKNQAENYRQCQGLFQQNNACNRGKNRCQKGKRRKSTDRIGMNQKKPHKKAENGRDDTLVSNR
jgi:hypothetical protein